MKTDGKFMVGNDIPEGQASVMELLSECFELNYELRVDALEQAGLRKEKEEQENSTSQMITPETSPKEEFKGELAQTGGGRRVS